MSLVLAQLSKPLSLSVSFLFPHGTEQLHSNNPPRNDGCRKGLLLQRWRLDRVLLFFCFVFFQTGTHLVRNVSRWAVLPRPLKYDQQLLPAHSFKEEAMLLLVSGCLINGSSSCCWEPKWSLLSGLVSSLEKEDLDFCFVFLKKFFNLWFSVIYLLTLWIVLNICYWLATCAGCLPAFALWQLG